AALGLLVALAPLFAVIAAAIKLDSPGGPVFYRQQRVGLDRRRNSGSRGEYAGGERRQNGGFGQLFGIYKFRTMIPDAEKQTGPVWATEWDPRITRVGRVLRKLRFDELPQLINVIHAEMRLIGPRPERPHFVAQLSAEVPEYLQRHHVPPGITGLAQVEREYDASVSDVARKIRYDLYYARHRSRALDMKILLKTIDVALRGRGAR
ncbi:MAG: sugar transferase, partial [Candidatus Eisenbacteria bacterium]|nr:sugar transferase [Candidatus Eisenbacteria bacterium]